MLKHARLNNLRLFVFINVTVILFASINRSYTQYYSILWIAIINKALLWKEKPMQFSTVC